MERKYKNVFKRYDIRGEYKKEIDDFFIVTLAKVISDFLRDKNKNRVFVAMDLRTSSPFVKNILVKSLDYFGIEVLDIGIGSTDYLAVMCKERGEYGVMITASHHPLTRTGFKIIDEYGKGLENEELETIKRRFVEILEDEGKISLENIRGHRIRGVKIVYEEAIDLYVEKIRSFIEDYGKIKKKFIIDSSLSPLVPLIKSVIRSIDNLFLTPPEIIHHYLCLDESEDPEPTFKSKEKRIKRLKKGEGFVSYDADADRVLFYFNGKEYGGNELLYALAILLKEKGCKRVVVSIDTSQEVIDKLKEEGMEVVISQVGDVFVSDLCLKEKCCFSGEPNNHFAFPSFTLYNSGFLSSLLLMVNAERVEKIIADADFHEKIKEVRLCEKNISREMMEEIERRLRSKEWKIISKVDGIKAIKDNEVVLIRKSGTKEMIKLLFYYYDTIKYEKEVRDIVVEVSRRVNG